MRPVTAAGHAEAPPGAGMWLAAGVTMICLATAGGSMTTTDAVVAFDVTRNLVEHHSIATSENIVGKEAYRGRDGRYYSPFGIAQSAWNIPFFLAGRTAASLAGLHAGPRDAVAKAVVALGTAPAVGLLAWICFALLRELGATGARSVGTVLLLVFGTPLWPYSGFGFNQPLAGMFLWLGVWCAVAGVNRGSSRLMLSGAALGCGILTRHEMAVAALIVGVWVAVIAGGRRRTATAWYGVGLLPGLVGWGALNWWRFGNPLESGYLSDSTPRFGSSIVAGASGLLFSPYASLFLYCPVAVMGIAGLRALRRHHPSVAALMTCLLVACFVLYASLGNWMGGRSYGPRYLVPLLPALVLPLAFWRPSRPIRRVAFAVMTVSLAVQIPGVLVDYSKVRQERAEAGATVAQDLRWSGTPLLLNTEALIERAPVAMRHLAGSVPAPRVRLDDPSLSRALSFSLDLWWLHLFYLGMIGRRTAVAIGMGLAAAGALALIRATWLARVGDRVTCLAQE